MAGFTLLEVLVAVAVFAIFAALAYGSLDRLVLADDALRQSAAEFNELQRTMTLMEADISQAIDRTARVIDADQPALLGATGSVTLTRSGAQNALDLPRSDLQRITWQITDDTLLRLVWPTVDRAGFAAPDQQALLTGITNLTIRYIGVDGNWRDQWADAGLPRGLEIVVQAEQFGTIRRLFLLPDSALLAPS